MMKNINTYKRFALPIMASIPFLPTQVSADSMSYENFYAIITDPIGDLFLHTDNAGNVVNSLNALFSWGMQILQFAYLLGFAIAIIACVVSIIRLILQSDNSKAIAENRHNLMVSLITLAVLGALGAIYVILLTVLAMF